MNFRSSFKIRYDKIKWIVKQGTRKEASRERKGMVSVEKKLEKIEEMISRLLVTCQVLTWLKILLLSSEQGEGVRNQGRIKNI